MSIFDADVDGSGNTIFAVGNEVIEQLVFGSGGSCTIPPGMYVTKVRLFSSDVALVASGRIRSADEINAWLINSGGEVLQSFTVGDGVADLFRTENFVVATYFDEGVFGFTPQGQEGLSVFDLNGKFLWGWNNTIAGIQAAEIDDCYSAVPLGSDRVGVFSYSSFQFGIVDIAGRSAIAHPTPHRLHGAILSIRDGTGYFRAPYDARSSILAWRPGEPDAVTVGKLESSSGARPRGLPGGRFLEVFPKHVDMVTMA